MGTAATIGCDAENCAYNEQGRSCTAAHIKVDGKRAQCTGETSCTTFKQKGCC
ncbi:MAG TPA: DUF1540 domain-containing protein [Candidatus Scatomorpha intestinigallinarum]|uniref:DUF1540 domain-containing protein n=1 Tax=Candidatus Scatomorpha intestinigallinarum TaxID=2840923 RepID=A0A9D1IYC3_9FIRM|nr:DUF1540 domain-containing protein [Candidatus Scatomorpha intestinigallinarum]